MGVGAKQGWRLKAPETGFYNRSDPKKGRRGVGLGGTFAFGGPILLIFPFLRLGTWKNNQI